MDLLLMIGIVALLWLALVVLGLALSAVASRADRLNVRALQQLEAIRRLGRLRSPSGKPFFPTPDHERMLLESVAELRPDPPSEGRFGQQTRQRTGPLSS